jgi:hypothetical protein
MTSPIAVKDIRPGDVLLHAGIGEISKLIEWVSDSDYSHAAMVIDLGMVAEAISSGVHFDQSLEERVTDSDHLFTKIDVLRPVNGALPVRPDQLAALQASAHVLATKKFALNKMFELGVVCVFKNKLPPDMRAKVLFTWLANVMIPTDPARLVCSEFVYRTYHEAATGEPRLLDPVIVITSAVARPFPAIDWGKLWKEYEEAKRKAGPGLQEYFPQPPLIESVVTDEELRAAMRRARRSLLEARGQEFDIEMERVGLLAPNAALVLPQDLADSPTFFLAGRATP